jgi:chromosome segregation ATPase
MDTAVTAAEKRAVELRKKIALLATRRRETESALARERTTHESATARRAELVGELAGADEARAKRVHAELDGLESKLRASGRVIESLSGSVSKIANEIASLDADLAEAGRIIEHERREQGLSALRIQLQNDRRSAEDAMGNARAALAALNRTALQGVERYGVAAQSLVEPIIEEFRHEQFNPGLIGWRQEFHNFLSLKFTVSPIVKG